MMATLAVCLGAAAAPGQAAAMPQPVNTAPAGPTPSVVLRQALTQVQGTTANLDISRWKTSSGLREAAQEDVDSIQRDLSQTLPGLLAPADAAPESVSSSFSVYRNVDALYDVLLRVSGIADFAAPPDEANAVASSLQQLEAARARLGDAILHASQLHEEQMKQIEAAIHRAKAAQAAPVREIVIDDGPVGSYASHKSVHKKAVQQKHEEKPSPDVPKSDPQ